MANLILNSLEIHNFRAFHDLKIEYLKRINLIVGKNNIGKTSLLEAIYLNVCSVSPAPREVNSAFVTAYGLRQGQITELWDNIAQTDLAKEVIAALRLLAPGIENINFINTPASTQERIPSVKVAGIDEYLSLSSLGNGMLRVLTIALALVNARDGILLIDEFENGLHYTLQSDRWRLIFQIAHRTNVQVFATTHSWDCIEAFQSATQGDTQNTALLIRLENRKHGIGATLFDQSELSIVTREQIEVR